MGFAYRLTKDGKTSLRGGAGIYYTPFMTSPVYMQVDRAVRAEFTTSTTCSSRPVCQHRHSEPVSGAVRSDVFPDRRPRSPRRFALRHVQRDLQIPQLITWNLTLERQFGTNWLIAQPTRE